MRSGRRVKCLEDIGQIFYKDKIYKIHTLDFPYIILISELGNDVGFDMNSVEFFTNFIILPSNKGDMKTLGKRFKCIQNVILGVDILYKKGKIYKSEVEGCITNERGNTFHEWLESPDDEYWKFIFRVIGNKRRSGKGPISVHPRR